MHYHKHVPIKKFQNTYDFKESYESEFNWTLKKKFVEHRKQVELFDEIVCKCLMNILTGVSIPYLTAEKKIWFFLCKTILLFLWLICIIIGYFSVNFY